MANHFRNTGQLDAGAPGSANELPVAPDQARPQVADLPQAMPFEQTVTEVTVIQDVPASPAAAPTGSHFNVPDPAADPEPAPHSESAPLQVPDPLADPAPVSEPVAQTAPQPAVPALDFDPSTQAGYTSVFAPLRDQEDEAPHINRTGNPTISMRNVTKIYPANPNKPALEDVSVDIYPGEFVFLVGHSGSGKSTFIKLLTRELKATHGQVIVAGQDLTTMRNWKVPYLRRQLGCVFQDFKLLPDKTTYENVAFTLECIGKPRSVIKAQVPEVLRLVGLQDKMDMFPDQLSGGEQQRVSVARAMVNRPPLLICDEPTGNLDPAISLGIMKLLERINRAGTTVLMATHDREMVDSMRKRVIALEAGHVVRDQERGGYGYYGTL